MRMQTTVDDRQERYVVGQELLESISDAEVASWLNEGNLVGRSKRTFAGFEITDSIDGDVSEEREVSLVRLLDSQVYPQHIHRHSDTVFVIVSGDALLLSGKTATPIRAGAKISIPRGTPHGFELRTSESLVFISVQQPPIRNRITGEEDLTMLEEAVTLMAMV
jgi:mannose-6-phosphate isomerase-like protein (cupin superfamily)